MQSIQGVSSHKDTQEKTQDAGTVILLLLGLCLSIYLSAMLRLKFIDFESSDYKDFVSHWYMKFREQGWHALASSFSDYTPSYPYLPGLFYTAFPSVSDLYAVKIVSIIGEVIAALLVWRITKTAFPEARVRPVLAALAVLFSPEVLVNGSITAQCDIWYSLLLLLAFYCLMQNCMRSALLVLGLSLSFKPWGIFMLPYFALYLFAGRLRWRDLWIVPAAYYATFIPALITGQSFFTMANSYHSNASVFFSGLNYNAMNIVWVVNQLWQVQDHKLLTAGILVVIAAALCGEIIFLTLRALGRKFYTMPWDMHLLALTFMLNAAPYFLPTMHERYFFTANLFAVILACFNPRYILPAILMVYSSVASYPWFLMPWDHIYPYHQPSMFNSFALKTAAFYWIAAEYYRRLKALAEDRSFARSFPVA